MIQFSDILLVGSEAIIIILGSLLVYVSARAYRRNKSRSMFAMSLGFAVIVVGSMIEEIFLEVLGYGFLEAHTLENVAVAAGLMILVYSIYGARS